MKGTLIIMKTTTSFLVKHHNQYFMNKYQGVVMSREGLTESGTTYAVI